MPKNIYITKASGETEPFDANKVINSLKRSGATNEEIKKVLKDIFPKLKNNMNTSQIYKLVYDSLANIEQRGLSIAGRYSLKSAISELGPTGFPFEKFIAGIFKELGYETQTNLIIEGKCVTHEIDILAKKDNEINIMESKFHKRAGFKTTVQTALYVYARYLDLRDGNKLDKPPVMWLVTNAKVTSEVKKYSMCTGLRVISWDYPLNFSLRELIDRTSLHPITALPSLDRLTKETLLQNGIVFCNELENNKEFFRNEESYNQVIREARMLTSNSDM